MKKWKQKEINFLKNNYSRLGPKRVSRILGKSYYSVRRKARDLKLNFSKKYSWKEEINFLIKRKNSIVDYTKIISTYSENLQESAWNYIMAKQLRNKKKTLREISQILRVPYQTIKNWASKTTPIPIKIIIKLTKLRLLPLIPENTIKFEMLLKIFSSIFGDGSLNKNLNSVVIAGDYKNLQKFKQQINMSFSGLKIKLDKKNTKGRFDNRVIEGISGYLSIYDSSLSRLLFAAGSPKGDKVIQKINFPSWIFSLKRELKAIFIGTLWSQDGTKPLWSKRGFHLSFQLSKSLRLKKEHTRFMNSIRKIINEFGINTGEVKWKNRPYIRNKDSEKIDKAYFYISSSAGNYIHFSKFIPNYSEDRKEIITQTLRKTAATIERNKAQLERFEKFKKMKKEGKSINEASKLLGVPYSIVKTWFRGKHRPIDISRR